MEIKGLREVQYLIELCRLDFGGYFRKKNRPISYIEKELGSSGYVKVFLKKMIMNSILINEGYKKVNGRKLEVYSLDANKLAKKWMETPYYKLTEMNSSVCFR